MRFFLKILTPEIELFQDHVDNVQVPAIDGVYEVLYNHAPIFIALHAGPIVVRQSSETEEWFIDSGTCHMENNVCTILARNEIDLDSVTLDSLVAELNSSKLAINDPIKRQYLEAQIAYLSHKI